MTRAIWPVYRETTKKRSDVKQSATHKPAISSIPIRTPAPAPAVSSIEVPVSISAPVTAPVTAPVIAPVTAPAKIIAPAASARVGDTQVALAAQIKEPVGVISDVSLACPVRTVPRIYPPSARKLGETGKVLLRVEIGETGRLVASDVARSSGSARLDEAALAAVKSWHCQPAMRDGQALRVVSIESFDFTLSD